MASVQARHSRSCALIQARESRNTWSTLEAAGSGCSCRPTYFVVTKLGRKRNQKLIGKDRRAAERARTKIQSQVDEGSYLAPKRIRFHSWADRWFGELKRANANTKRSYVSTLDYAKDAFGTRWVNEITPEDLGRFLASIEGSPATVRKHLRVLSSCLRAAVRKNYAPRNPCELVDESELARVPKLPPAHFTDSELERIVSELDGIFRALVLSAAATGLRLGELSALRWKHVRLVAREMTVERSYTVGLGEGPPKGRQQRTVDLVPEAERVLVEWLASRGDPGEDELVFPSLRGGYLSDTTVRRTLYEAMERAGVPRAGAGGRKRNFHSLRHTFARRALEAGAPPDWLKAELGHSSITLTIDVYGAWARDAMKKQAAEIKIGSATVRQTG